MLVHHLKGTMYRVAAFFVVVLGNPRAVESASETALCRCEASFERLYDRRRRHLLEGFDRGLTNSASDSFPYDYGTAYINDEGYFVIDGVVVLPDDNELCQTLDHDNRVKAWMTLFGERRNLKEDSNKQQQEQQQSRALRGKLRNGPQGKGQGKNGMMSGAIRNDPSEFSRQYYFYGQGKAYGKGAKMGKVLDMSIVKCA